jgi:hypothetical protein
VARSWQIPTAATETASSWLDNASTSLHVACLGPDMIRKIDEALKRSFLRGQGAANDVKSAIAAAPPDAGGAGGGGSSEPSRDVPVGHEARHKTNGNSQGDDDDDDDIFGNVGEYDPDDDEKEEEEEHESGRGQKDGAGKATKSTSAPSAVEASGSAKERRRLFGNVMESVAAGGATSAPARPRATGATPGDGNDNDDDDDDGERHKGATRLAGLSEVVDAYGDDMDADFTGMHDEDPDQPKKKTKTKGRKKKSGESDSE